MNEEVIRKAKEYIKGAFAETDKAHDYLHSLRVYENARIILRDYPKAIPEVVLLSALFHDLSDKKLFPDDRLLVEWFREVPSEYEHEIMTVVSEVGFSKKKSPSTVESAIVQDADLLDAIGAIGIARCFTFGAHLGRPIYSPTGEADSLMHFDEKLFHIKGIMNTPVGRAMAEKRDAFMHEFIEEFREEVSCSAESDRNEIRE